MHVYILFSQKAEIFYIGFTTKKVEERLEEHLTNYYGVKFTSRCDDWKIYWKLECGSIKQGLLIEKHIKKMKSKIYIQNLAKYPEISLKLLSKYIDG